MAQIARTEQVEEPVADVADVEFGHRSALRGVESVSRALDILEALALEQLGLMQISRRTGLRPSTVHRMLATLSSRGYVRRDPATGRFSVGYPLLWLGTAAGRPGSALKDAVRPFMETLHKVCGETVYLAVLDGHEIVYLDLVIGPDAASKMYVEPGRRVPVHASALGKSMLAFGDEDSVVSALEQDRLERYTARTITIKRDLAQELEAAHRLGFAVSRGEFEESISCVAAPIFCEGQEHAVGAMSVSGPTSRLMRVAEFQDLGEFVGRSAMDASRVLGYTGPSRWHEDT